jgi:UDP-N-acetylmuramoyl-tripeptide--D-alanyl-D-alanine ligase
MMMNLQSVAAVISQPCSLQVDVVDICTDSRQVKPGSVFIAIEGEHFDGHAFVADVEEKGALAAVVRRKVPNVLMPQWVVDDPLIALAQIAKAHRQLMNCPVIALTGSNGKTTVKEMIASILPQPSHATKGNLNNHIGVPLSVLALREDHRFAVFELGANHPGEIAYTADVVQPKVVLINNIAPAHIQGFGSIEGIARAKGELFEGLDECGIAVVNDDDAYAHFWDELLSTKSVVRFSIEHAADVYAHEVQRDARGCFQGTIVFPHGQVRVQLRVPGLHNARNALAAAACCDAVGISLVDIERGLNNFTGVKGRMTVLVGKNNATIFDDTYNANLKSALAGLEVLAQCSGTKILVFGDMGELGDWSMAHHQEVGNTARRLGIDQLVTCGVHSKITSTAFGKGGQHFDNQDEAAHFLITKLNSNTSVLVKGSRSSAMEKIVHQLLNC